MKKKMKSWSFVGSIVMVVLISMTAMGCYKGTPISLVNTNASATGGALASAPDGNLSEQRIVTFSVTGKGLAPETAISPGQGRLMAERAAISDGYRQLVEKIRGVYIDAFSQTTNGIVDYDIIRTKTQSWIRGVEIIAIKESGYGIMTADMQLRIYFTQNDMIWWPTGLGNDVIPGPSKKVKHYIARPSILERAISSAEAAVEGMMNIFIPDYGNCSTYPWCGDYYYY